MLMFLTVCYLLYWNQYKPILGEFVESKKFHVAEEYLQTRLALNTQSITECLMDCKKKNLNTVHEEDLCFCIPSEGLRTNVSLTTTLMWSQKQKDVYMTYEERQQWIDLSRNQQVGFISTLKKEWEISFDLKPLSLVHELTNVITLSSTGNNYGAHGDRIPGMFFYRNTLRPLVYSSISGYNNFEIQMTDHLQPNQVTHVNIKQYISSTSVYTFSVKLNGTQVYQTENTTPMEFENVTVHASNKFYATAVAQISNLKIESGNELVPMDV